MPLPGYIVTPVSSCPCTMPHSHASFPYQHIPIPYPCLNSIPPHPNTISLSQFHTTTSQYHTSVSIPYHHIPIPYLCFNSIPLSQLHVTVSQYHTNTVLYFYVMLPLGPLGYNYKCFSHYHNHFSDLQDRGSSTINLIHPSSKKQLCDSFRVEDPAEFDQYIATN